MSSKLAIVFDGPPANESGRFIEVELDGAGVSFGEWQQNGDYWELVLPDPYVKNAQLRSALLELKELLGPGSGYHIAPDDPPGEFIEGIRIESIFERADAALAADWFCPTCDAYVSGETVTFEEVHEVCGTSLAAEETA